MWTVFVVKLIGGISRCWRMFWLRSLSSGYRDDLLAALARSRTPGRHQTIAASKPSFQAGAVQEVVYDRTGTGWEEENRKAVISEWFTAAFAPRVTVLTAKFVLAVARTGGARGSVRVGNPTFKVPSVKHNQLFFKIASECERVYRQNWGLRTLDSNGSHRNRRLSTLPLHSPPCRKCSTQSDKGKTGMKPLPDCFCVSLIYISFIYKYLSHISSPC